MPSGFIAPASRGWNTRDAITNMEPGYAHILDNFVIEGGVPRVRQGWRVWSTGLPGRVDGLFGWNGTTNRLFAASGAGIYDVTGAGTVGAAVVSGLTSARWNAIQFAASGGQFLFAFNGADTPRTFDGTTWASWTGTGVTGGVAWAASANGRLFLGNPSRLSFFYGAAGAIAGTFTEFPLTGIAQRGGGVVAMATLSQDGGAGPQTLTVFLTSQEEAIVYAGTDPSSASAWQLVGTWRIPRLLGAPHRCVTQYGGDAIALTDAGLLPLTAMRQGQDAQITMERVGLTRRIAPTWRAVASLRGSISGWQVLPLPRYGLMMANAPLTVTDVHQIVVSEGGAVTRWQGMPASVWAEALGGRVFFGDATATGRVMLWGEDNADGVFPEAGTLVSPSEVFSPLTISRAQAAGVEVLDRVQPTFIGARAGVRAEGVSAFSLLGGGGRVKHAHLVEAVIQEGEAASRTLRILANWLVPIAVVDALPANATPPALPSLAGSGGGLVWDVGQWDVNVWSGTQGIVRGKRTASAEGHSMAVHLRLVSGEGRPSWVGSSIVWSNGGPVR